MIEPAPDKNLKIHSVQHVIRKLRDNIPNEEARRKIVGAQFVINAADFAPFDHYAPEINGVYELILLNKRINDVIKDLEEGVQRATKLYKDARRELSLQLAADGLEPARLALHTLPPGNTTLYPPSYAYLAPSRDNAYQFPIRIATLGKRIEGLIGKSEERHHEQKWYLAPDHINHLPIVRRDLYDRLKRERTTLTEILTKL